MKRILLVAVLFISAYGIFAGGNQELVVIATDPTYEPFEFRNEKGELDGFGIEVMEAAAKAGWYNIESDIRDFHSIFSYLEEGEYDAAMATITITDERKQKYDFSIPYLVEG